jgi:hypothetical protein
MSEIKTVWITTRLPIGKDPGEVEIGYYTVADGLLQMCDETGKPKGKNVKLEREDNPAKVAGRLTKEAWMKRARESTFNRPLNYRPLGIA